MNITVIGGTGHIGTFLVPRLVEAGHSVTVVSRQQHVPYQENNAWQRVRLVGMDRAQLERNGSFGRAILDLAPEVIIDLICFTPESARQLVNVLQGKISHYLHCGTLWVHGHKVGVPSEETHARHPFGEYGIQKAATERYLLEEVDQSLFPVTILHPGHIVGPGWVPINPVGNFDRRVFSNLANGREVLIPGLGMETLHHVHADDVAAAFMLALTHRETAVGEAFHVLSGNALTFRGYAEALADWYGQPARLKFVSWEDFSRSVSPDEAACSWDHLAHSSIGSIEKARRLLQYSPRYTSLEAIKESLAWLENNG